MNAQTHQGAAALTGTALLTALVCKLASHYGYNLGPDDAAEILGILGTGATYLTQYLASRGVKLALPVEPAAAPVAPAQPAA